MGTSFDFRNRLPVYNPIMAGICIFSSVVRLVFVSSITEYGTEMLEVSFSKAKGRF